MNTHHSLRRLSPKSWRAGFYLCLLLSLLATHLTAQDRSISGTVTDEESADPLIGVTVQSVGSTTGTVTDIDGKYQLSVPEDVTKLRFTYLGYVSREVTIGNQTTIDLQMATDNVALDEVVVIGYGSVKKSDLTGAVVSLTEEDFNKGINTSVDQMLQGRAAGVQITQTSGRPGAGVSVRIRGNSSINLSNEPLYVIDGVPISNGQGNVPNVTGLAQNSASSNPLNTLNPADIASVEILKDASATAIYGSRASNGVVLITTKKGATGAMKTNYNVSFGLQKVANKIDVFTDGEEFLSAIRPILEGDNVPISPQVDNAGVNVDWQDELFQTSFLGDGSAPVQNHSLSFSGGNQQTNYYASLDFLDQEGVVISSGLKRYGARLNLTHKMGKFTATLNLNTSFINEDATPTGNDQNLNAGVIHHAIVLPPSVPLLNADGERFKPVQIDLDNPFDRAEGMQLFSRTSRTLANVDLSYAITSDFSASMKVGTDISSFKDESYLSTQTLVGENSSGLARIFNAEGSNYVLEGLLNYNKVVGQHNVSALAGYTFQEFSSRNQFSLAQGFTSDDLSFNNLGAGDPTLASVGSGRGRNALLSYLSRVNYTFNDRYLVTFSMRADGSSRFSPGNKWGYFPSVALGWRLSEESFLAESAVLSNLKLRLGWGQIGNESIGNGATLATFEPGGVFVQGQTPLLGLEPSRLNNPDLTWETTTQTNFGIDFGFVDGRISGSVDYFDKRTTDLLFQEPTPLQTGFRNRLINLEDGEIKNNGWEFSVNTVNSVGAIGWSTNLNATFLRNEVVSLGETEEIIQGSDGVLAVSRVGDPAFSYFGLQADGIFQIGDDIENSAQPNAQPGFPRWVDQNNDGVINDADNTILGNPYPDFTFGINNTFTYKNFEFSFFIEGVQGIELFNFAMGETYQVFNDQRNRLREPILNRWTTDNPTNEWPSFINSGAYGGARSNSFVVEDASFIRLKNVQFGYTFGPDAISFLSGLKLFVSGQNLALITNYTGFDPDVNSRGRNNVRVDRNSYPAVRSIVFGANVRF